MRLSRFQNIALLGAVFAVPLILALGFATDRV